MACNARGGVVFWKKSSLQQEVTAMGFVQINISKWLFYEPLVNFLKT